MSILLGRTRVEDGVMGGSREEMVGAVRFELTTSCTRNKRASQATLRPDKGGENADWTPQLQPRSWKKLIRKRGCLKEWGWQAHCRTGGVKPFQPSPRNREQVVTGLPLLGAHNRVVICAGIGT